MKTRLIIALFLLSLSSPIFAAPSIQEVNRAITMNTLNGKILARICGSTVMLYGFATDRLDLSNAVRAVEQLDGVDEVINSIVSST